MHLGLRLAPVSLEHPDPNLTFCGVSWREFFTETYLALFFFFPSLQVKARAEDLQREDFPATVRKIQEAVELKLLDLSNLCAPKKNKVHGLCRLVYRSKHSASKISFSRSVSKEPAPAVSATEVIRELQMREASLQRELKQLREECRQRLDEIAEGLDGVICISP